MFSATERAKPRQRSRITTGSTATWLWFADLRVTVAERGVYNKNHRTESPSDSSPYAFPSLNFVAVTDAVAAK